MTVEDVEFILDDSQVEPVEPTTEGTETPDETPVEKDDIAEAFFDSLVQRGILAADEDFDGTFEYVEKKIDELPVTIYNNLIEQTPEVGRNLIQYVLDAGGNLTVDKLREFYEANLAEQAEPDIDNADEAREYLEKHLKGQGLKPRAIEAQLEDIETEGSIVDEAKKIYNENKQKLTTKLLQEQKEENERIAKLQEDFNAAAYKEVEQYSAKRQQAINSTVNNVGNILSNVYNNPKSYVQFVDLLSYYDVKTGEFNLEGFEKRSNTTTNNTLRDKLKTANIGKTTKSVTPDSLNEEKLELVL